MLFFNVVFAYTIIYVFLLSSFAAPLQLFSSMLNERQQTAVQHILEARGRPVPYILFGPPGTGKSVVIVEAILQIFKCIDSSRVLICAPSNSAADLLVGISVLALPYSEFHVKQKSKFQIVGICFSNYRNISITLFI